MPVQSDFPPKWACESPQKSVKFEVRVPDKSLAELTDEHGSGLGLALAESRGPDDYNWIEIPVVEAELYVEKGDAAQIQRTAKVRFPTEWGKDTDDVLHNSPRQLITRFDHRRSEQFMFARMSFKHPDSDEYVLDHFGWVGGVGQSADDGVSKLWVYDVAEMLEGVFVGTSFSRPTIKGASEKIARLINDNTPIPVSGVYIVPPRTEEQFAETVEAIFGIPPDARPAATYHLIAQQSAEEAVSSGENFQAIEIDTGITLPFDVLRKQLDTKTFEPNHDTLRDVIEWFERKTGSEVHFEPAPGGDSVVLFVDVEPERRTWIQREVAEQRIEENPQFPVHGVIDVLKNNALYEMKPFNTLYLRGDTAFSSRDTGLSGAVEGIRSFFYGIETEAMPSKVYPSVKVQVPALLQAAEGVELAPELVESDAESLEDAEAEAIAELRKLLEEETEGHIKMLGHPQVLPFDQVISFEQCGEHVTFEPEAASYEVEGVKHSTSGGDIYKTRLTVSVWANDEVIEVVESKMENADG